MAARSKYVELSRLSRIMVSKYTSTELMMARQEFGGPAPLANKYDRVYWPPPDTLMNAEALQLVPLVGPSSAISPCKLQLVPWQVQEGAEKLKGPWPTRNNSTPQKGSNRTVKHLTSPIELCNNTQKYVPECPKLKEPICLQSLRLACTCVACFYRFPS